MGYSAFIKDKQLVDLIETLNIETMKNRVLVARVKKKTYNTKKTRTKKKLSSLLHHSKGFQRQASRKESFHSTESGNLSHRTFDTSGKTASLLDKALNGISTKSSYYIFLISQKPLNAVDEEYFHIDHEVMEKKDLPSPIEFNKIMFYTYKSPGDSSEPKKILAVETVCSVQVLIHKKEFHLKIKLENGKYYFFMFQQAVEALLWLDGLRSAIKIQEEITRSKFGVLKYNAGIIYKLYETGKQADIDEIIEGVLGDVSVDLPVDLFLARFESTKKEVNFLCDAFYSYKPFVPGIFQVLLKAIHSKVRVLLMEFWNVNYLEMTAGEILTLGREIYLYKEMLKNWGVLDRALMESNKPIIDTFCNRLFDSSKEVMFNVIDEAMYKFQIENKIYRNRSIKILESHVNICFQNYSQVPTLETAFQLVDMLLMIITIVQMNLISQVQNPKKNIDIEVLASLLNNDFEAMVQRFMKKIHKKTKSEISINDIRRIINYKYLQRNHIKMSQVCLVALNNKLSIEVKELFLSQHQSFPDFKMKRFIEKIDFQFSRIFLGLCNVHEKFDILDKMCLQIVRLYFDAFLRFCRYVEHGNLARLVRKIRKDQTTLLNYFRPFIDNDLDCHIAVLGVLVDLLQSKEYVRTKIILLKLVAFFGAEFGEPHHVRTLIKCKVYFSSDQVGILTREFEALHEEYLARKANVPPLAKYLKSFNPKVIKFINILKKRLKGKLDGTVKMRSSTINFRPQNTDLMLTNFSIDQIYNFTSKCLMIKFPKDTDEFDIEEYITSYLKRSAK